MIPDELTETNLLTALEGAQLVYFDGRLYETALVVAQEVTPTCACFNFNVRSVFVSAS